MPYWLRSWSPGQLVAVTLSLGLKTEFVGLGLVLADDASYILPKLGPCSVFKCRLESRESSRIQFIPTRQHAHLPDLGREFIGG